MSLATVEYHLEESISPTFLPVSVADVKSRLDIEHSDDDCNVESYINDAADQFQERLSRQFAEATYIMHLDGFEGVMCLPRPPVSSVTSIKYLDTDGTEQTLASSVYRTVLTGPVPYVELAYGQTWPSTRGISRDVTITFVCGYSTDAVVPARIKNLIVMFVKQQVHGECGDIQSIINSYIAGLRWRIQ